MCCILNIYSTNIRIEYFKHAVSGSLNLLEHSGPVMGLLYLYFYRYICIGQTEGELP
jgi:hypothetical protein